ncbi:MAG: exodeoxyribonuclease III [Deltaproteobacteria bacterium]|nr:exodeoxyribonuclease III [Deltaproteobacteria bacterium]
MKLISWNVNGLRAVATKGFHDWLAQTDPDILGLQEIKCKTEQLTPLLKEFPGYHSYWNPAQRPGYSGVALFTKQKPIEVQLSLGIPHFDDEGRTIIAEYENFFLINSYYPNGRDDLSRVSFKLEYSDAVLALANKLKASKPVLLCGDFNTAHQEIDLARPKENQENTGFLPQERAWIDKLLLDGYVDIFRKLNPNPGHYSWWSYRAAARKKNVGWRIDYFFVSENFVSQVKKSYYQHEVLGSDHCPVVLETA